MTAANKTTTTVRKYANRKLYDETSSRYLSMLELSDLVASGQRVVVVCDLTGNDITVDTLARALYERVKVRDVERSGITPVLLSNLIAKIAR